MSGTQGNREFTEKVLKYGYQNSLTDKTSGQINGLGRSIAIPRLPNENSYAVTAPDCIVPVAPAFPVFTYARGNQPAGIALSYLAFLSKASNRKQTVPALWQAY